MKLLGCLTLCAVTIFGVAFGEATESAGGGAGGSGGSGGSGEARGDDNRFGLSQPLPRTDGAIRLATYNVLNLFDHVDDPALDGEHDDLDMATAPQRCAKLAEAIRRTDADIIALEEVESLAALRWFRDTYLSDAGYLHLASPDAGYYRGVECSVMSRFPITRAKVWPGMSIADVDRSGAGWSAVPAERRHDLAFRRSPLLVEIEVSDTYSLTILAVHHKAGRNFKFYREAEALKIVELLGSLRRDDPARNIVVMGDFNCAPWDKSMRVYLQDGFIDTLAHRVVNQTPESGQYKTHESDRVLDYILLNSAAHRELVIGSPHVFGTLTPPPSYDYRRDPHPPGYASDHYPVIIDLVPQDRR